MTPAEALGVAETSASTTPSAATGALPDRYALGRQLGAGGMGEVMLATDHQIGREVAIKRMRIAPTPSAMTRFIREAKVQGRLDHPAIVPVHELATDGEGRPFFVMKRLTGRTLAAILDDPTPPARHKLLRAFADVCLAVEFAHSRGVIHRDLKPANITLGDFGEVYVLDWGIARVSGETDVTTSASEPSSGDATQAGAILGTPGYIAPEIVRGEPIDSRTDVYGLGCILFEILTGQPHSRTLEVTSDRPSQRAPDREIPPELDDACAAALAVEQERRPSARGLAEQIERYLDGDRDLALRKSLAATHLDAARAALAAGDGGAERATAMREAGRAIALDPHGKEAAQLVGRLMLEPPREVPPEVTARVAHIEEETTRKKARVIAIVMFSFLLFVPAFAWLGIRSVPLVGLFASVALLTGVLTVIVAFGRRITIASMYALATMNSCLIGTIAHLFSPFLIAPWIAALSAVLFVLDARVRWHVICLMLSSAVLVAWLLELLGVVPRTMSSVGGDLLVHSEMLAIRLPEAEIVLASALVLLVWFGGLIANGVAAAQRGALRSIELQAWHLRQLVG